MRWFLASRFSLMFARSLVAATLSYHVFIVTDSYAALGVLGLVEFFPVIPSSLVAGVVADRFDRKKILIVVGREDVAAWRSVANLDHVHPIAPDQLNTYDVLHADDVVFSVEALDAFVTQASRALAGKAAKEADK